MPDVHIDKIDNSVNEAGKDDGAFTRLFDSLFRRHKDAGGQAEADKSQRESDRSLSRPGRPPD